MHLIENYYVRKVINSVERCVALILLVDSLEITVSTVGKKWLKKKKRSNCIATDAYIIQPVFVWSGRKMPLLLWLMGWTSESDTLRSAVCIKTNYTLRSKSIFPYSKAFCWWIKWIARIIMYPGMIYRINFRNAVLYVYIYPTPPPRARCNRKFSFPTRCQTKVYETSLPDCYA